MTNQPLTRNVTRVFRAATPDQIASAVDWYQDARNVAHALAIDNGVTLDVAVGVIAALSPMQSWGANVNLAARFLAAGGLTAGYLSVGLAKAQTILDGGDIIKTLHSDKITNFYRGIVAAGETDAVCVDRHAYDIAVNERNNDSTRPKFTGKRYAAIADVYKRAADILAAETGYPLYAAQVQSITWVTWRERYWARGAFDSHNVSV